MCVCVSEASCPNFEPRAHARLTGLTIIKQIPISRSFGPNKKSLQNCQGYSATKLPKPFGLHGKMSCSCLALSAPTTPKVSPNQVLMRAARKGCLTLRPKYVSYYAFGKTPRGSRCARQARQRLATQRALVRANQRLVGALLISDIIAFVMALIKA